MRLRAEKVVFNKALTLEEGIKVFSILKEVIDPASVDDNYFYVYVRKDYDIFIETVSELEVFWIANKLGVSDKQGLICLMEYPYFWENLKDHLHNCRINNFKRYMAFTKADLMGESNTSWEEYMGESNQDAHEFFSDILMMEDVISVIEVNDEEEEEF